MPALFSSAGLARASGRHPWRTLGLWLLIIIGAALLSSGLGGALSNENDFTNDPDSKHGETLIKERIGAHPLVETVVFRSTSHTVDDPAFQAVVEQTSADLLGMTDVVVAAPTYYQAKAAGDPGAEQLVSADRHTTIIQATLASSEWDDLKDDGPAYIATAQGRAGDGFEVYTVGDLSGNEVYTKIADEDLSKDLTIGLPVAAIVLVFVFGALVAAGLPILLGIVSIFVAMGLAAVAARIVDISSQVTIMITMIGLAVGIDYALFVVERYREERRHGMPKHDAIAKAGGTAGKAVFFSGATVILALLGMFLIPVGVFHSLAAGAILAVLVAIFATQTFVPALLGLVGDKIDWPRRRSTAEKVAAQARYGDETIHAGFWGRVTQVVMRHPVAAALLAVALLVGLALPALDLKTGVPGIETYPASDVTTGYHILEREFYAGGLAPVQFVIDGNSADPAVTTGVDKLVTSLRQSGLYGPVTVQQSPAGDLTVVDAPLASDPNASAAYDEIGRLRHDVVPAAFGDLADHVYVTGATASTVDFNGALREYTPLVFAFVLGLSFVLLMMAFRSIIVPLKAILMNLLSVGAACGALVAVFQKGIGADLLGITRTETIVTWIPVFLFCVLFGLSMDYHVFLLSRIREHYDLTHRNDESVAVGLQSTAKIITGAAIIMVAVFGAFASGRMTEIQQMGFGLAVAIFLDATIVRSILVPAAMRLLGDRNWYLPRWLGWLPDLRIEGAPAASPAPIVGFAGGDD